MFRCQVKGPITQACMAVIRSDFGLMMYAAT
ncbi:hypothetical protein C8E00_104479 [Chromohalobacter marismortui]|uniref:Uncharacterized protein n=1 Tax=Chromohalobacter marismortui TaxID=42055 RepID=A0A4R7NNP6_9GAMM|nr:hypothetical protein C8E00_104479 [Chromohalobacter marismortui]